jgi:hypothetical protein
MLAVKGEFKGLYDFDLRDFYKKSNLARGSDLIQQNSPTLSDPELASVRAQTAATVAVQQPILS